MELDEMVRQIVAAEQTIIGDVALTIADGLPFLTIEDAQVHATTELTTTHIDRLVTAYENILGAAAIGTARRALQDAGVPDSELPDALAT